MTCVSPPIHNLNRNVLLANVILQYKFPYVVMVVTSLLNLKLDPGILKPSNLFIDNSDDFHKQFIN